MLSLLTCGGQYTDITELGYHIFYSSALPTDPHGEMHLQPTPLFHLPSDNISMLGAIGTPWGRIFLAGKDGCLYEVEYQVGKILSRSLRLWQLRLIIVLFCACIIMFICKKK